MEKSEMKRLDIIDGFRAFAIISVILFHFCSRWLLPRVQVQFDVYPYKHSLDYFGYGNYGVQFFFIISGFVIHFTLLRTQTLKQFWIKRMVRLIPSLFVATCITFLFFYFFGDAILFKQSSKLINFIPSLTFITPAFYNYFISTSKHALDYINGSYWSLWTEIQFYFFVSIIYYFKPQQFFRNFIVVSLAVVFINWSLVHFSAQLIRAFPGFDVYFKQYCFWAFNVFNIVLHILFFAIGVIIYKIYEMQEGQKKVTIQVIAILFLFMLIQLYLSLITPIRIVTIIIFMIWLLFLFKRSLVQFFSWSVFSKIGFSSYFLYLIHEHIGVYIIYKFAPANSFLAVLFIAILIASLFFLSIFFTQKIDTPINHFIKNKLLKPSIKK